MKRSIARVARAPVRPRSLCFSRNAISSAVSIATITGGGRPMMLVQ